MRFGTSILSSNWLLQKISASECGKPKPSWTINYMGGNPSPHDKLPPGYPTIPVMAGLSPTIPNYPGCGWTTPNYPAGLSRWTIPLDYPQLSQLWLDYPQLSQLWLDYPQLSPALPVLALAFLIRSVHIRRRHIHWHCVQRAKTWSKWLALTSWRRRNGNAAY